MIEVEGVSHSYCTRQVLRDVSVRLPERRVGVIGFREFTSNQLAIDGVEHFDLEYDVRAFNAELPRVRIIPLQEFDPTYFLR